MTAPPCEIGLEFMILKMFQWNIFNKLFAAQKTDIILTAKCVPCGTIYLQQGNIPQSCEI